MPVWPLSAVQASPGSPCWRRCWVWPAAAPPGQVSAPASAAAVVTAVTGPAVAVAGGTVVTVTDVDAVAAVVDVAVAAAADSRRLAAEAP